MWQRIPIGNMPPAGRGYGSAKPNNQDEKVVSYPEIHIERTHDTMSPANKLTTLLSYIPMPLLRQICVAQQMPIEPDATRFTAVVLFASICAGDIHPHSSTLNDVETQAGFALVKDDITFAEALLFEE